MTDGNDSGPGSGAPGAGGGDAAPPGDAGGEGPASGGEPVEELSTTEATPSPSEVIDEIRRRKAALEGMPDGPRPPTGERYKRRRLIVDFPLQLSYVGVYVATVALLAVGFVALNYVFTSVYERALKIQQHGLGDPFPAALQESSDTLLLGLLNFTFVLLLLIGMAVYAIIQSHRVAGPAYRFRRALSQLARRDYDFYLQLRRKDYLHDLAEQVNVLNNGLKAKDLVVADASVRLAELSETANPETAERLQELATELADVALPLPEEEPGAVAAREAPAPGPGSEAVPAGREDG